MTSCTKAIIPVAGYGTRRLPITKAIEKCMLPLGNRPVIDYIVRDCVAAGITDIYFVVSGAADQLRAYYGRDMELETYLAENNKVDKIDFVMPPVGVRFHYIEQDMRDSRYGTAVPVWLCKEYVRPDELMLVVMGDDVTYSPEGPSDIERLVALDRPAILGVPMPRGDLANYGVIALTEAGTFSHIVEKPAFGAEPSRMINVSKYVLPGRFMGLLDAYVHDETHQGEFYITDPINQLVVGGEELTVCKANGEYLDTGSREAWVRANQWLLDQDIDK